jgi:ferredoxin
MPVLKSKSNQVELAADQYIMEAAESLGVPFGCERGTCGTCLTEILDGLDHLSKPSRAEIAFGCMSSERLICQCRIIDGEVTLNVD